VLKSVLAAITDEAIWCNVRPPLRAADAGAGVRIAALLSGVQARVAA